MADEQVPDWDRPDTVPDWDRAPTRITVGPSVDASDAFGRGILSGASFNLNDELAGLARAGGLDPQDPNIINQLKSVITGAYRKMTGDPEAEKQYQEAVTSQREANKAAEEQHSVSSMLGNVTGAMAVPMGAGMRGATLSGRMARGAMIGAPLGAIAGFGAGEGLEGSLKGAAVSGLTGLGLGAVAAPMVEGAIQAGRAISRPIRSMFRGAVNPEAEAARRLTGALQRDVQADPAAAHRLTPAEFAATPDATIMDLGSETTRALARSAANTSPEGRQAINDVINDRFEGQTTRVTNWLRRTFNFPNAHAQQEALDVAQRAANRPAYLRAEQEAARLHPAGLWDQTLDQISQAPVVQDAIRKASVTGANRAARQGFTPIGNPFSLDRASGRMVLSSGVRPNLGFWDEVKKNLDQVGSREARDFARVLREHIDQYVPAYRQARAGAAQFFDAENALEAGQNFVNSRLSNREARAALARMSPTERQLFQDGYVDRLVQTLNESGDRRSILNQLAASPAARERLEIALGRQRAAELEATLRIEGIMDLARGAVQGNSTTARQLAELGFAGGAGSLGAYGTYNLDPTQMTTAALMGALLAGRRHIDQRVARRVAEMLSSRDPAVLAQGIRIIARSNNLMEGLRSADRRIIAAGSQQAAEVPALQAAGVGRAEDEEPSVPRPPGQKKNGGKVQESDGVTAHADSQAQVPTERNRGGLARLHNNAAMKAKRLHGTPFTQWSDAVGRASGGRIEPTEAQKEAGNYKKDHVAIHGLPISIENRAGSKRSGTDKGGKKWSVRMPAHYGYIKGTVGRDKDHVDCYVGPNPASKKVFIVNQLDSSTGKFDEHKCMLGFANRKQAENTYKRGFSDGKGGERLGHIAEATIDEFKNWLNDGNTTQPVMRSA